MERLPDATDRFGRRCEINRTSAPWKICGEAPRQQWRGDLRREWNVSRRRDRRPDAKDCARIISAYQALMLPGRRLSLLSLVPLSIHASPIQNAVEATFVNSELSADFGGTNSCQIHRMHLICVRLHATLGTVQRPFYQYIHLPGSRFLHGFGPPCHVERPASSSLPLSGPKVCPVRRHVLGPTEPRLLAPLKFPIAAPGASGRARPSPTPSPKTSPVAKSSHHLTVLLTYGIL